MIHSLLKSGVNKSMKNGLPFVIPVLFVSFLMIPVITLSATAYKCITENNVTVFSDKPCAGSQSEEIYIHEHFTEGETLRPDELKMLREIEEREKQQSADEILKPEIPDASAAKTEPAPEIDTEACEKATNELLEWQRVMKLGYQPEESDYFITELNTRMNNKAEKCGS